MSAHTIAAQANSHDEMKHRQSENLQTTINKEKVIHGRSVLASLNQNNGRIQPFRAAKQV